MDDWQGAFHYHDRVEMSDNGPQLDAIAPAEVLWRSLALPDRLRTHAAQLSLRPPSPDPERTLLSGSSSDSPLSADIPELAGLPLLRIAEEQRPEPEAELRAGEALGEGGMGVVQTAWQRSLERDVAIKRVRGGRAHGARAAALVREARVVGALEHPSIVPLYGLGVDQDGRPVLVMKRIDGVAWRELIRDPKHPAWRKRGRDQLVWHVETLIQVCQALELAHSRGVLHRDIKPDNVMIGGYGAVYLVDWGLAGAATVAEGEAATAGPPSGAGGLSHTNYRVLGTPAYMAPEMVGSKTVNERSDVYLVGSTLHEVLVGSPPHAGETFFALLQQVHLSAPKSYPSQVPAELAAICNKARAKEPEQRYPSVGALRQALSHFLQRRSASTLADEAEDRLRRLADSEEETGSEVDQAQARTLLTECRFGFQQALAIDPDSQRASEGLRHCLRRMVELELDQQNAAAAAALLGELEPAPADLRQRLGALRQLLDQQRAQLSELRRIARDQDVTVLSRARGLELAWLCVAALVVGLGIVMAKRAGWVRISFPALLAVGVLQVTLVGIWVLWSKSRTGRNAINKRLMGSFWAAQFFTLTLRVAMWRQGATPEVALIGELVMMSLVAVIVSISFDRQLRRPAALCVACLVAQISFPGWEVELLMAGTVGGMLWGALIWVRSPHHEETRARRAAPRS